MRALILYYSKTGHTEQAARGIARGLEGAGVECVLSMAGSAGSGPPDPSEFDILVLGTPTYGNRMYRQPARQVQAFLDSIGDGSLGGKTCGAFAVNAGWGASRLVGNMERALARKGASVMAGGPAVKAGAPLSLWKGPDASAEDVRKCEEFGRRLASSA